MYHIFAKDVSYIVEQTRIDTVLAFDILSKIRV